jgi:hypothetical protein
LEIVRSGLVDNEIDGRRKALPIGGFGLQLFLASRSERVELGLAAGFAFRPFGPDPALLLKAMEGRIERALLHLQHFARHLLNTLGDGPAVHGFGEKSPQDEKVERTLDKIIRLSHA